MYSKARHGCLSLEKCGAEAFQTSLLVKNDKKICPGGYELTEITASPNESTTQFFPDNIKANFSEKICVKDNCDQIKDGKTNLCKKSCVVEQICKKGGYETEEKNCVGENCKKHFVNSNDRDCQIVTLRIKKCAPIQCDSLQKNLLNPGNDENITDVNDEDDYEEEEEEKYGDSALIGNERFDRTSSDDYDDDLKVRDDTEYTTDPEEGDDVEDIGYKVNNEPIHQDISEMDDYYEKQELYPPKQEGLSDVVNYKKDNQARDEDVNTNDKKSKTVRPNAPDAHGVQNENDYERLIRVKRQEETTTTYYSQSEPDPEPNSATSSKPEYTKYSTSYDPLERETFEKENTDCDDEEESPESMIESGRMQRCEEGEVFCMETGLCMTPGRCMGRPQRPTIKIRYW